MRALFVFPPQSYDEKTVRKKWNSESIFHVNSLIEKIKQVNDFNAVNVEKMFHEYLKANEVGFGKVMPALRLAITGLGMGPSMFLIMELLGKKEVLSRLDNALLNIVNG